MKFSTISLKYTKTSSKIFQCIPFSVYPYNRTTFADCKLNKTQLPHTCVLLLLFFAVQTCLRIVCGANSNRFLFCPWYGYRAFSGITIFICKPICIYSPILKCKLKIRFYRHFKVISIKVMLDKLKVFSF